MFLICGLGNFGQEYDFTRHNVGFAIVDIISRKYCSPLVLKEKFKSQFSQTNIANQSVILLKPQTYMNLSGQALQLIVNYYKILLTNIIIIHDDLDLEFGKIKVKIGGSSAGHNGIKSVDQHIGKNYLRIRVGIGKPKNLDIADYVLQQFSLKEKENIEIVYYKIVDSISLLLTNEIEKFIKNTDHKSILTL